MTITADEHQILTNGLPPSTEAEMEFALEALYANKDRWAALGTTERIQILDELLNSVKRIIPLWVEYSQNAKGVQPDEPGGGEDWAFATILLRQVRMLRKSLQDIQAQGRPQIPGEMYTRQDGRVVAEVFPSGLRDQLLFSKLSGEIWFQPGVMQEDVLANMAKAYHQTEPTGKVALVLGAGNVSALVPGDFVYKLFVENQVVILKMNPVNEYLGPLITKGYAPLISRGFLRVVYGDVPQASYLIDHDFVDELHVTGSDSTFEAIVFGTGDEGTRRKAARDPKMTKRFTAELGNITPIIVVPGPWTNDDIAYQAAHIASQLTANAGFNCLTPRMIVQHAEWDKREALNRAINDTLAQVPARKAYYPGAQARHQAFMEAHESRAHTHGDTTDETLPWTYITNVDPSHTDDITFNTEAFCSLMAETALTADSIPEYIDKAVAFCNDTLWGTLTATLIVHPESMKDEAVKAAVERAVANLRYGTVCINTNGGIAYAILATAWGSHSGQDIYDVQSGIGFVNNTLLFDDAQIQKSVVRNTFRSPLSGQHPADTKFNEIAEQLTWFEAEPNIKTAFQLVRSFIG